MKTHYEKLLTRKQAAEILNVSLRTVDVMMAKGQLPVVRFATRCIRIRPSALAEWVMKNEKQPLKSTP